MDKWADFLISEVNYNSDHLISVAIRHQDTDKGITKGKSVDRLTIASDINNGLFYITIYSGKNSWKKGHKIQTFSIGGNPYLRIDGNKVKLDYFGDLPKVSIVKSESIKELELQSEPPVSSRGSLPKESAKEVPQELDLVPEPIAESEEEATPEQLSRLEQLEKQIQKFEDVLSAKLNPSFEEATPEQFSKVKELEKEIKKLETIGAENEITQTLQKRNKKLDNIKKKLRGSKISKKIPSKFKFPEAYCVKCRTKRKIENPEETTMKNGRAAIKGTCSVCHCKVFRIGKMKK